MLVPTVDVPTQAYKESYEFLNKPYRWPSEAGKVKRREIFISLEVDPAVQQRTATVIGPLDV